MSEALEQRINRTSNRLEMLIGLVYETQQQLAMLITERRAIYKLIKKPKKKVDDDGS